MLRQGGCCWDGLSEVETGWVMLRHGGCCWDRVSDVETGETPYNIML